MPAPTNFETAFDRLFPLAENTARAVVIDGATAEKVAIETLARARARWDRIGSAGDPTAWVLRTAMALADKEGPKPAAPGDLPRHSPKQLLELVQRRAARLQARRKAAIIGLVVLLVGSAVTAAVALTSPSRSKKVAAGKATTTTEETFPETTTTLPPDTTTTLATPTTAPAAPATTAVPAAGATTTSLPCRNSKDPRCGPFRWDPNPGANSALTVSVVSVTQDSQTVTFVLDVVDADASPIIVGEQTCNPPDFGDVGKSRCSPTCTAPGYGPWTPPARQRGTRRVTYTHHYDSPGNYTAHFWFGSAGFPCPPNPYASFADTAVPVTVSAPPSNP